MQLEEKQRGYSLQKNKGILLFFLLEKLEMVILVQIQLIISLTLIVCDNAWFDLTCLESFKKIGWINSVSDFEFEFLSMDSDSETIIGSAARSWGGKMRNRNNNNRLEIMANLLILSKNSQKYPHSQLQYEYVSQHIAVEDLPFNLCLTGE
jgi:hypothetical protein